MKLRNLVHYWLLDIFHISYFYTDLIGKIYVRRVYNILLVLEKVQVKLYKYEDTQDKVITSSCIPSSFCHSNLKTIITINAINENLEQFTNLVNEKPLLNVEPHWRAP